MALKLNATREAYQEFPGRNTEQMPKLIADGRVPMNVSQLMQRRIELYEKLKKTDPSEEDFIKILNEVYSAYMDNYFDTGDAAVYHPDGRVKIVLDSQHLREINSDNKGGALILSNEVYNTLEGEEFERGKLGKIENSLSLKEVKAHPVWKALARDPTLLNHYAELTFAEGKQRFGYDEAMGVYPDSASDTVKLRSWFVNGLGNGSNAGGRVGLDYPHGRLLGIAPEALSVPATGASNIQAYTMADLHAVDKMLKGLEGVLHPDVLKPIVDLRKKL